MFLVQALSQLHWAPAPLAPPLAPLRPTGTGLAIEEVKERKMPRSVIHLQHCPSVRGPPN